MELKLEIGKEYAITHKRKGFFRARLIDVVKTPRGDKQDKQFLTFEIDTSNESGQEHLARVKGAKITVTNIRPSLITHIKVSTRSPKLPEPEVRAIEEERPKRVSFLDRLGQLWPKK